MESSTNCESTEHSEHAIDIFPIQARLPWVTGNPNRWQNKHCQLTLDTANMFLAHFACNESVQRIFKFGHSISEISYKELRTTMEESWVKFPTYLFPESNT